MSSSENNLLEELAKYVMERSNTLSVGWIRSEVCYFQPLYYLSCIKIWRISEYGASCMYKKEMSSETEEGLDKALLDKTVRDLRAMSEHDTAGMIDQFLQGIHGN